MKVNVNRESPVPIRDQLIEQIGLQIASGLLRGEEKLPSIRALAQRLGIHYNTVSSAYNHLAEVGLLDVRQGSGVRVASKMPHKTMDLRSSTIDDLLRDFLAVAAEHGFSRQELQECVLRVLSSTPIARVLVIDRNEDFHPLLVAELQPHINLPVEPISVDALRTRPEILNDSLVVTSLYHVFALQHLQLDPTRLVTCNVEPGRAELDLVGGLPNGSLLVLVSVSPTLIRMATNIMSALRGEEIAIRTIAADDIRELEYSMPYANLVICDLPSQAVVSGIAAKCPLKVFRLYSDSTIELINDRLKKWG